MGKETWKGRYCLKIIIGKLQKEIIISESPGTGQDSLIHLLSVSLGIKYRI